MLNKLDVPENPPRFGKEMDDVNVTSRLLNLIFDMPLEQKIRLLRQIDQFDNLKSRRHTRRSWVIPIEYAAGDRTFQNLIKDISAGGVFIQTAMPFAIGQALSLKICLPNCRKWIQASGKIVRVDSDGIGVKFQQHAKNRNTLRTFVG